MMVGWNFYISLIGFVILYNMVFLRRIGVVGVVCGVYGGSLYWI